VKRRVSIKELFVEQPHKSGYVAVAGRPNVGKSSIMNAFLGQKLAAVSQRPQMTRRRQLGILTLPGAQVIFVDTPGIHKPVHKLGQFLVEEAFEALDDADVILMVVDATQAPNDEDRLVAAHLLEMKRLPPVILALNKADRISQPQLVAALEAYLALIPQAFPLAVSALTGFQRDVLLDEILKRLPEGPQFYDPEQITDLYEREIAADLIREAAMANLRDEVPHSVAVRIDEFNERNPETAHIVASLYVERDSQKGILIGSKGEMLKKIGTMARKEIESMSGRHVFLELFVKVRKNWRDDPDALQFWGYVHEKEE